MTASCLAELALMHRRDGDLSVITDEICRILGLAQVNFKILLVVLVLKDVANCTRKVVQVACVLHFVLFIVQIGNFIVPIVLQMQHRGLKVNRRHVLPNFELGTLAKLTINSLRTALLSDRSRVRSSTVILLEMLCLNLLTVQVELGDVQLRRIKFLLAAQGRLSRLLCGLFSHNNLLAYIEAAQP